MNPQYVHKNDELLPGGDIRKNANQWVRAAFSDTGLKVVPRENRIREAVAKLVHKKRFGLQLSCHGFNMDSTFPPNLVGIGPSSH